MERNTKWTNKEIGGICAIILAVLVVLAMLYHLTPRPGANNTSARISKPIVDNWPDDYYEEHIAEFYHIDAKMPNAFVEQGIKLPDDAYWIFNDNSFKHDKNMYIDRWHYNNNEINQIAFYFDEDTASMFQYLNTNMQQLGFSIVNLENSIELKKIAIEKDTTNMAKVELDISIERDDGKGHYCIMTLISPLT